MVQHHSRRPKGRKAHKYQWFKWCKVFFVLMLAGLLVWGVWSVYSLNHIIKGQFEGGKWSIPSHVYARPMVLYPGKSLQAKSLIEYLEALGYQGKPSLQKPGDYVKTKDGLVVYVRAFRFWDKSRDAIQVKVKFASQHVSLLEKVKSGEELIQLRLEPLKIGGIYPRYSEDRVLLKLAHVPSSLIAMLLLTEDRDFFEHRGVSIKGIARAVWTNIKNRKAVQGGSTLTQQLVKNYFLTSERTLSRKIKESIMALLLEWHYRKSDILQAYLNEVYLGQDGRRAIHGFGLASQYYFGRPVAELTVDQQALLVAMVKGASYYNPRRNAKRAKERRDLVLKLSHTHELIDEKSYKQGLASGLGVIKKRAQKQSDYQAFIDLVIAQIKSEYSEDALQQQGLKIFTTLDTALHQTALTTLASEVSKLEDIKGYRQGYLQSALVMTNPHNGEVLSLIGSSNQKGRGFNRAMHAKRSIGSLIKPFIYLAAIESEQGWHPASKLNDAPITLRLANGDIWQPENYNKQSHGEVLLAEALINSYNQATVRLGLEVGLGPIVNILKRLGLKLKSQQPPSFLLGTTELTPLSVHSLYQNLSSGGFNVPTKAIMDVLDSHDKPLKRYPLRIRQSLSPDTVYVVNHMLQSVMTLGTGKSHQNHITLPLMPAGKTGTSSHERDSWFVGYTNTLQTTVWIGNDEGKKIALTGSRGALRVWSKLMAKIMPPALQLPKPDSVAIKWIDRDNGLLTKESCQRAIKLAFLDHQLPTKQSSCSKTILDKVFDWM